MIHKHKDSLSAGICIFACAFVNPVFVKRTVGLQPIRLVDLEIEADGRHDSPQPIATDSYTGTSFSAAASQWMWRISSRARSTIVRRSSGSSRIATIWLAILSTSQKKMQLSLVQISDTDDFKTLLSDMLTQGNNAESLHLVQIIQSIGDAVVRRVDHR